MKTSIYYALLLILFPLTIHGVFLEQFQGLQKNIPYIPLANLPTPIQRCTNLEKVLEHPNIFVKRDDLTGSADSYGGNKVRKLEFLLADALAHNAKKIITFGCVGTNHGLATACYAHKLGLGCTLMLKPQPNSPVVRQNLLLDHYFHADIKLYENKQTRTIALDVALAEDKNAYFFPTGGSVPLGALGYVNAAFELKKQIDEGILPEPTVIYLPIGSCGTTAGLLLGLQMTNLQTKIIAVAVEPEESPNEFLEQTKRLFTETNQLLHTHTTEIPLYPFPHTQLVINKDFCGQAYGVWLSSTVHAAQLIKETESIVTEGTYSAKAIAALVADSQRHTWASTDVILFWNTYCGIDFSHITKHIDYMQLPQGVHHYFQ